MPVEPGVGVCNDRPGARMVGRFTGEISGVELREGGGNVIRIER